jgi:hypothetical protein
VCYELQEVHNDKVELHYDISTLNLLGLIETPEDQIIRDEGNIKIFLKKINQFALIFPIVCMGSLLFL